MAIPAQYEEAWHVEEEFVQLVRGEIEEGSLSFDDGVKNIEFLEACHTSVTEGQWIALPLL